MNKVVVVKVKTSVSKVVIFIDCLGLCKISKNDN